MTPLLDTPLHGSVYLRSSSNKLPDLVAALRGPAHQPIEIDLAGRVDSPGGVLRTTFGSIPDTPVTSFTLRMKGGKKGLLVNSSNLCARTRYSKVKIAGHNGARADQRAALRASCKSGSSRKKRAKRSTGKAR